MSRALAEALKFVPEEDHAQLRSNYQAFIENMRVSQNARNQAGSESDEEILKHYVRPKVEVEWYTSRLNHQLWRYRGLLEVIRMTSRR
ncbi:hypothetical protein FRC03_011107 [Tulasnella sp. 419]|nr:hypothetical protein FRC03_011107 [Tulasnella sp. 419]